jgi:hypothetical protein
VALTETSPAAHIFPEVMREIVSKLGEQVVPLKGEAIKALLSEEYRKALEQCVYNRVNPIPSLEGSDETEDFLHFALCRFSRTAEFICGAEGGFLLSDAARRDYEQKRISNLGHTVILEQQT